MFVESINLELKENYSRSYLKTVSAFANERNGQIIFGVADDGVVVGVDDDTALRLQIENAILNNFSPVPDFTLKTKVIEDKKIVILSVTRGTEVPYFYQEKAYMRLDTSTFVADSFRMRRWFQELYHVKFEEVLVDNDDLRFNILESALKEKVKISTVTEDTLVTLGLKSDGKFTNAGRLLADENSYGFGVDIVKYGRNYSEFVKRLRMTNQSIIKQYEDAMAFFDLYYHDYEVVYQGERVKRTRIPRDAFREALANAIVHRDYQMNGNIQIEFWDSHIKLTSPGGLTNEITAEQYLNGNISLPRNATIANIFYRLKIIETMGTGIGRIKHEYRTFGQPPKFDLAPNLIEITLPVIDYDKKEIIDSRHADVIEMLVDGPCTRAEIQERLMLSASSVKNLLNDLLEQDKIERFGSGRATKYRNK